MRNVRAASSLGVILAVLVGAFALACAGGADHEPVRITAYPHKLPDRPGREIAEQSCLLCHSATLLTQQHKDSTAWAKTLAQMEKWDAPVAPAQRDSLLGYLVRSLGPH
jgi:cytochrome c5